MICGDFDWTATWRTLASSLGHGGRASLEFIKAHLEEGDVIHVVT
jgi:hypothetical protein